MRITMAAIRAVAFKTVMAAALLGLSACGDDDGGGQAETVTRLIGPEGGVLTLSDGTKLDIPEGALTETTPIKITKLELEDVTLPYNLEPAGKPYKFEPHGTLFVHDVKVTLPYEPADDDEPLSVRPIKSPDEDGPWNTIVGSDKDEEKQELSFDVRSFSVMIAARPRRDSGVITLPDGAIVMDGGAGTGGDGGVGGDGGDGGTGGVGGSGGVGGTGGDAGTGMLDAGLDADVDAGVDAAVDDAAVDGGVSEDMAYIKASNTGANDYFGNAIAIDGNTLVVSAFSEDSNATGVNGDESNNGAIDSGAVYVFIRGDNGWVQEAYLKASNTGAGDEFGLSVAISGDTIVIGAPAEDSNATGVNGNQGDSSASNSGAAYVFVRNGSTWTQQAYLKPSTTRGDMRFGTSVAISGSTIVVGAPGESSNATLINGDQSNTSAVNAGAAYVFTREGSLWSHDAYLKAPNAELGDAFGTSVAIAGYTIVIGATGEDSSATHTGGNENDNTASNSGAAYVFDGGPGNWFVDRYLKASNTGVQDNFGWSVAISGGVIVVGAPAEDGNATGIDGAGDNDLADLSGAAYLFGNNEGSWQFAAYLKASNTGVGDQFGHSVAILDATVVIGAKGERSNATGIDGDQLNNSAGDSGAAYVFRGSDINFYYRTWEQVHYLKASNTEASDELGIGVGVAGENIVVSAIGEDSNATGTYGDTANNSAASSGAAYAFDIAFPLPPEECDDGYDDDFDGDYDCDDSDCVGHWACVTGCNEPAPYTPLNAVEEGIVPDGLTLWLRADVGVALDEGEGVCSWADQSGRNHHVAQDSISQRPTLFDQDVGGMAALDFNGLDGLSRPGVLDIGATSGRTIFAVADLESLTARSKFFFQGHNIDNSAWIGLEANTFNTVGQRLGCYMSGNAYDSGVSTDLEPHVHTLLIDSMVVGTPVLNVMHHRVDGTASTLTRTSGGTGNGLVESFSAADISLVGFQADADIAEVIVYDRPLSTAEIAQVESYLAARYSL